MLHMQMCACIHLLISVFFIVSAVVIKDAAMFGSKPNHVHYAICNIIICIKTNQLLVPFCIRVCLH